MLHIWRPNILRLHEQLIRIYLLLNFCQARVVTCVVFFPPSAEFGIEIICVRAKPCPLHTVRDRVDESVYIRCAFGRPGACSATVKLTRPMVVAVWVGGFSAGNRRDGAVTAAPEFKLNKPRKGVRDGIGRKVLCQVNQRAERERGVLRHDEGFGVECVVL